MRMMMVLACLLVAATVQAQTHPCDQVVVSPGPTLIAGPHTVSACWTGTGGTWTLTDNGVKAPLGIPSVSATANASGLKFYSWPLTLASTGSAHTYSAEVCISDGAGGVACQASAPFVQPSVTLPLPPAPVGLRVQ